MIAQQKSFHAVLGELIVEPKPKLYTVTVHFDYVVVAEDVNDADLVARGHIRDALSDIGMFDVDVDVVEGVSAYGWDGDCIPYGGDGNTRTKEYLNESQSEPSTSA